MLIDIGSNTRGSPREVFNTVVRVNKIVAGIAQTVQWIGHGLDDRGIVVRFPARAIDFSLLRSVQMGSVAHAASCSVGHRATGQAMKLTTSPSQCGGWEWVETYLHSHARPNGVKCEEFYLHQNHMSRNFSKTRQCKTFTKIRQMVLRSLRSDKRIPQTQYSHFWAFSLRTQQQQQRSLPFASINPVIKFEGVYPSIILSE